jgi:hypothetical protein
MPDGPITISAAIFVALIFLDLFRHEYKKIPVHSIFGFFVMVLMSTLCEHNYYFLAWVLLFLPFLILGIGLFIRESRMREKTLYPVAPLQTMQPKNQPYPYHL